MQHLTASQLSPCAAEEQAQTIVAVAAMWMENA